MQTTTVCLPAEWEPQSFIQFTFPHDKGDWAYMFDTVVPCFVDIINASAQFEPVLVGCASVQEVAAHFTGATPYPIYFVEVASNDTWTRDHGAISVLHDGQPVLCDFTFNGWGQKFEASLDNQITGQLSGTIFKNIPIEKHDFVLEGGAIESDGKGTLLTTSACLLSPFRNPHLEKVEITNYLKQVFGLKKVLWLDHGYLAGDDTDSHIDTLARFCTPNVIVYVKCTEPKDEHFEALQKMEQQLKSFTNYNQEPYILVPLPWPQACYDAAGERIPATYANFLIVNGGVLVPTYDVPQDKEALAIIQSIFPDRKIVGIDCRALIDQHGSLHCVSMQYPKQVTLNITS